MSLSWHQQGLFSTPQMSVTVWVKFMTTVGAQQVSILANVGNFFLVCREPCGSFSTTNVSGTLVWSRSFFCSFFQSMWKQKWILNHNFLLRANLQLDNPKLALNPTHEPRKWVATKFSFLGTKLPNPNLGPNWFESFQVLMVFVEAEDWGPRHF